MPLHRPPDPHPGGVRQGLLTFAAGVLATTTIEDTVPGAHEGRNRRLATSCVVGGVSLFMPPAFFLG